MLRILAWALALALVALPVVAVVQGWIGAERWPLSRLRVTGQFERVQAEQLRAAVAPYASRGYFAADLDAECSACLMGARRLGELFDRYGAETVESCFDAIISRTTATYRREILSKIPVGTWTWEDYAEHDGVGEALGRGP